MKLRSGDSETDPTTQFEWHRGETFEAEGYPHRTCISAHAIPNASGLLRSEMMIITGMMLGRMESEDHQQQEVFPVRGLGLIAILKRDC
jgi:hypothetical protein